MKNILFLFCFQFLFSQNISPEEKFTAYQNYINLAKFEFYKRDYKKSGILFKKAFSFHSADDSYDLLDAAASALYNGENNLAEKYIAESITDHRAPLEFIMGYEKLKNHKNSSFLKELPDQYDAYFNAFYAKRKNLQSYLDADLLMEKDQMIRNLITDLDNSAEETQATKKLIYKELDRVDEKNAQELIELTKKYGYQDRAWILLWHHRDELNDEKSTFWEFFKPIINQEIKNGKLYKSFFTLFEDDNYMTFHHKQKYGIFPQMYLENPIADIKNVDKLREEAGLPPLSFDIIVNGYPQPEGYKMSEADLQKELERRVSKYEMINSHGN
jgi:hypothetical protein